MNILLIGGPGSFINNLIIKLNKEGHRVYLLTGSRYEKLQYQKVFERYNFNYDNTIINEIFESINPDVTIYMGTYDSTFKWINEEAESVKYSACLMNILMGYAMRCQGRFIYLSNETVYGGHHPEDITEETQANPDTFRGMAYSQAEEMCDSFRRNRGLDVVILRLDHVYSLSSKRDEAQKELVNRMCLEALEKKTVTYTEGREVSLLYETDAIESIYRIVKAKEHNYPLYNISSSRAIGEREIAERVQEAMGEDVILNEAKPETRRLVLSNRLYDSEIGNTFFCEVGDIAKKIADKMKKNAYVFLNEEEEKLPLLQRIFKKMGWFIKAMIPFVENLVIFVPFFWLNNRAVGSEYFSKLDFYLLYVLLFAIVYGQQQATFSAILSIAGFIFRETYTRSGFELMLDANTYVWIAQLLILGLVVGYMHDQIAKLKNESEGEVDYLAVQLHDIQDINNSNVRVKDALETQIVNQNDSVGKIYSITSALDQYSQEEVLFYAAEMVATLMKSSDVAIYTVSNAAYARLFSSTSKKARMLGHSIKYPDMGELYDQLTKRKVFINRTMDERYPLMANAIYDGDQMQMIVMIWGIPWERMTLGQANQLVVISALIQNAVLRANRYMSALEDKRYVGDSRMLEQGAFTALMSAYLKAEARGLTECTVLKIDADPAKYNEVGAALATKLRNSDYIGTLEDGCLYSLLSNTSTEDARFVINRFKEVGYESTIVEDMVA